MWNRLWSLDWNPGRRDRAVAELVFLDNQRNNHWGLYVMGMLSTHRPLGHIEMLQQGCKTSHLDNVAVAFHADHVDGLTAGSLHVRPVGGAAVVAGRTGVFADENGPVA